MDLVIRQKVKTSDSAVGGNVLVLFAYWFAQFFQFDTTGLLGKLGRMNKIFVQHVQGLEQCCCEATSMTRVRCRPENGHAGNFQVAFLHARQLERFSYDGVLDFVNCGYFFQMGIFQQKAIHKPAMNRHVDVFITIAAAMRKPPCLR